MFVLCNQFKEPLVLINPRVTEVSQDTVVYEQCLSIPKSMRKPVKTVNKSFTLECDNLGTVIFSERTIQGF